MPIISLTANAKISMALGDVITYHCILGAFHTWFFYGTDPAVSFEFSTMVSNAVASMQVPSSSASSAFICCSRWSARGSVIVRHRIDVNG